MNNEVSCPGCGEILNSGISICPVCATQLYGEQAVISKGSIVKQENQNDNLEQTPKAQMMQEPVQQVVIAQNVPIESVYN